MARSYEKHKPYFELVEALERSKGCALCAMRKRSTRRYAETLLYENINDPQFRRRLRDARGFCKPHAKDILECGDGLSAAILYQDQVEDTLQFLARLEGMTRRALRKKARAEWIRHEPCPLCEHEEETDIMRIETLRNHLDDPELRQALEKGPGFCVPHLIPTLERLKDPEHRRYVERLHREKLSRLLDELHEFIRKHDYRHTHESYGREADSWQRAPRMLLGDF